MLLEEVKYYDVSSLRDYVEKTIVPLAEVSSIVKKHFPDIDEDLAKYAEEIHTISKRIIELAEEKLNFKVEYEAASEPQDIYEIIEYGRLFLEKSFNFTIASNPYTFFIWSIRKITKSYLEAHYPKLFEKNTFKNISSILGLEKYWEPPEIKPRKIVEDYTIYAYLDYKAVREEAEDTIGGLVSKMNEKILFKLARDDIKSYGVLYEKPNLYETYQANIVNKILEELNWRKTSKISNLIDFDIQGASFIIRGLVVSITYSVITEWRIDRYGREYGIPRPVEGPKISLFNFLDEIMPLQMLGIVEMKINRSGSGGSIEVRPR